MNIQLEIRAEGMPPEATGNLKTYHGGMHAGNDFGRYAHVYCDPREMRDGQPEYPHDDATIYSQDKGPRTRSDYMHSLRLSCQTDHDLFTRDSQTASYAWRLEYLPNTVDQAEAEAMYKTLKRTNAAYAKLTEEFGYPKTYGQFCLFQAKALRAKGFVYRNEDGDFSYLSLPDGASKIDRMIDAFHEHHRRQADTDAA